MPRALNSEIYLCSDCGDGGTLSDADPLLPENLGIVRERRHDGLAERVLGIVFAARDANKVDSRATTPVLVLGQVDVAADDIAPTFTDAVMERYADCYGPNPDGSCRAMGACALAELLRQHSNNRPQDDESNNT